MRAAFYEDPDCVGHPGPYVNNAQYHVQYMHDFFKYISSPEHKSPIDFFSWHTYSSGLKVAFDAADYCKRVMDKYGFGHVENCLTEWNTDFGRETRNTPMAAAKALAMMLGMQKKTPGLLCYYDGRATASIYGGLFNAETIKPRLTYFSFMMFNGAYKLGNEVETSSDSENIFVLGAKGDGKSVLLISNIGEAETLEIEALGVDISKAEVLMISDVYHYSPTGLDISNGTLKIPRGSCVEIRFY
jgi:hypothetical protein